MKLFKTLAVSAAVALASTAGVANAGTLQDVQSAGELKCVVTTGVPGFGAPDDSGRWTGFDVDFCRALYILKRTCIPDTSGRDINTDFGNPAVAIPGRYPAIDLRHQAKARSSGKPGYLPAPKYCCACLTRRIRSLPRGHSCPPLRALA